MVQGCFRVYLVFCLGLFRVYLGLVYCLSSLVLGLFRLDLGLSNQMFLVVEPFGGFFVVEPGVVPSCDISEMLRNERQPRSTKATLQKWITHITLWL